VTCHVMLDLETLSTRKNAAIVQIAAIAFDPTTGAHLPGYEGAPSETFNRFVRQQYDGAHIDPATVAWWMQQPTAASLGKKIETTGVDIGRALYELGEWYAKQPDVVAVWSHGATFDISIVEFHCAVIGLKIPWHYRHPRDTRTLFALAPGGMPAVQGYGGALTHDALYDCEIQIKQVVGALAALRDSQAGYR
jgi:hypothetical protein